MKVENLKAELRRKQDELRSREITLDIIEVRLFRAINETSNEIKKATEAYRCEMNKTHRDIDKAEKLRQIMCELTSKPLISNDTQCCLDDIKNLNREINQLKQEIQVAEQPQRNNAYSFAR